MPRGCIAGYYSELNVQLHAHVEIRSRPAAQGMTDPVDAATAQLLAQGMMPLGACLLAALHPGVMRDSRSFARVFGMAHALVLREVAILSEDGLVTPASLRALHLTAKGARLLA